MILGYGMLAGVMAGTIGAGVTLGVGIDGVGMQVGASVGTIGAMVAGTVVGMVAGVILTMAILIMAIMEILIDMPLVTVEEAHYSTIII
jgi:hypothetical protein